MLFGASALRRTWAVDSGKPATPGSWNIISQFIFRVTSPPRYFSANGDGPDGMCPRLCSATLKLA